MIRAASFMRVPLSSAGIRVVGMKASKPIRQRRREGQQEALAEDQPPRDRLSQHLNRVCVRTNPGPWGEVEEAAQCERTQASLPRLPSPLPIARSVAVPVEP